EARRVVDVRLGEQSRRFVAGERIHTEYSYKWTAAGFAALLNEAGFSKLKQWQDADGGFALFLAEPA
ncbi:MAG: L-histidine N(alpha)-methyltransferase, partial [Rhodocyclaceae bacterium]|nr:L-histidine N(alpha)-methyltransferase [Rhodocyclaceae bacterium]